MNVVLENITSRRSIRKFTTEPLSLETIQLLLMAAMNAPSACNQQDWHFFVITDRAKLETLSTLHGGLHFVKDAPVAILICAEPSVAKLDYYWIDECAAAAQNLLLAAHSLNLGAIWTGIDHNDEKTADFYRQAVGFSDHYVPFCLIPIGYPAEKKEPVNNFNTEKITWK